jgi:hypothetical protein
MTMHSMLLPILLVSLLVLVALGAVWALRREPVSLSGDELLALLLVLQIVSDD